MEQRKPLDKGNPRKNINGKQLKGLPITTTSNKTSVGAQEDTDDSKAGELNKSETLCPCNSQFSSTKGKKVDSKEGPNSNPTTTFKDIRSLRNPKVCLIGQIPYASRPWIFN